MSLYGKRVYWALSRMVARSSDRQFHKLPITSISCNCHNSDSCPSCNCIFLSPLFTWRHHSSPDLMLRNYVPVVLLMAN